MEKYTVGVKYTVTHHTRWRRQLIHYYDTCASILFFHEDNLIIEQPLSAEMCSALLNLVQNNEEGMIENNMCLSELRTKVAFVSNEKAENSFLTWIIDVGYGGPQIRIKVLPCMILALQDIQKFYQKQKYQEEYTENDYLDWLAGEWITHYR